MFLCLENVHGNKGGFDVFLISALCRGTIMAGPWIILMVLFESFIDFVNVYIQGTNPILHLIILFCRPFHAEACLIQ